MMSRLQYLIGHWWLSLHLMSSTVCTSHSLRAGSFRILETSFWTPLPCFGSWETQSGVFFLEHIVIARLHTRPLYPTQDIFVLFMHRKRVVGIVLWGHLIATLSVASPWVTNVIAQLSACTEVHFCQRQTRWRWLRHRVCDVFNMFEVGKRIQLFDWIFVAIEFTTLSRFNASGWAVNSQIILACNLKVFRMVEFDMIKLPAVWGERLSAWKFGATARGLLCNCWWHLRSGICSVERDKSWCWAWVDWCVSSRYFQLTWEIVWVSTPSQGGSLHARSCKNAACAMSHNTVNGINPERSNNLATRVIINAWDKSIKGKETNKTRTRP